MRFIVCVDVVPNEMTDFADVILPSSDVLGNLELYHDRAAAYGRPMFPPASHRTDLQHQERRGNFYELERLGVEAYNSVINMILGFEQKPELKLDLDKNTLIVKLRAAKAYCGMVKISTGIWSMVTQ